MLGMAVVTAGTDRATRTPVAIKTVALTSRTNDGLIKSSPPSPSSVFHTMHAPASYTRSPAAVLENLTASQARRELAVCRHVRHPCLIPVHDVFVTPDVMHIVTDMPGHNVQCVLNFHGVLAETIAARICYDVLQALEYLHAENIVHRSVIPANVCITLTRTTSVEQLPAYIDAHGLVDALDQPLARIADFSTAAFAPRRALPCGAVTNAHRLEFDEDDYICSRSVVRSAGLCDMCGPVTSAAADMSRIRMFGIARVDSADRTAENGEDGWARDHGDVSKRDGRLRFGSIDRQTLTDAIGSATMAAPEMRDSRLHGPAADMWSVGILAYYMVTGRLPQRDIVTADVFHSVQQGELFSADDMRRLSQAARNFIVALLRPNPRLRLTAGAALRNQWLANVNADKAYPLTVD